MKVFVLMLLSLQLVSSARAETVKLTDSYFAKTTVAVTNSSFAQHHVYFTKSPFGADCALYLTDSAFAQSTVRVVKNPLVASTTVRQVDRASRATSLVYISKSALSTFGHCDFAAALLAK